MLTKWLKARRRKKYDEEFNRGYNYAAGILLRNGGASFLDLEDEVHYFGILNPFALGMHHALYDYKILLNKIYNDKGA